MTTDIDRPSTATIAAPDLPHASRRHWRRPLLVAAAAAAGVAGVAAVAVRAGTDGASPTPAPVVPAGAVVAAPPAASVEPDWCIEHRPC